MTRHDISRILYFVLRCAIDAICCDVVAEREEEGVVLQPQLSWNPVMGIRCVARSMRSAATLSTSARREVVLQNLNPQLKSGDIWEFSSWSHCSPKSEGLPLGRAPLLCLTCTPFLVVYYDMPFLVMYAYAWILDTKSYSLLCRRLPIYATVV
jgi:hypothetical protein